MASKRGDEIEVCCPICKGTLSVDAGTGHVLHAEPRAGSKTTFDSALGDVLTGESRREGRFKKAFESEAKRTELLDKKFEKAKERAEKDPSKPHNPLDMD